MTRTDRRPPTTAVGVLALAALLTAIAASTHGPASAAKPLPATAKPPATLSQRPTPNAQRPVPTPQRPTPTAQRLPVLQRRLNRVEYENTVRDLLGIEIELKHLLPPDSSEGGFDNNVEALHVSPFLLERYLEAADLALNAAIVNGPQPLSKLERYSYQQERQITHEQNRNYFRFLDDGAVVFFSSTYSPTVLGRFYPPLGGKYRFRISVSGFQSAGKPVTFRVQAGSMLMGGRNHLAGYFDAPADQPKVIELVELLEPRDTIQITPYGTGTEHDVRRTGADAYPGAGLAVHSVEVEGPLNEVWPPASHRRLLGELPQEKVANQRLEVVSKDPTADAWRVLRPFVRRAFRRTVTDAEVRPFVELVETSLAENATFEQALRVGLRGVLVSPDFLFLREEPGKLGDSALASRLSYFLWSSHPDEELLALAEQNKLGDPATLRRQVERMLASPKAAAFTRNFAGQWLGLRDIDFTLPDHRLYPEYDELLKFSMLDEAYGFFDEVLKQDLPLTSFVVSDFTMLNARLAKHYGISGVEGHAFRKVTLPPDSHRGGVLTMAAVLKVTANGTNTSPIVRGAWVLSRILGTPPPPPPAGVPAVEPDIRGATNIRDQLAKHRDTPACSGCHARIDPPGFALESFDVIGGWRENYRSVGNGRPVTIDGKRMPYLSGLKVDPSDTLPDGSRFTNVDEFKQVLLKDKDRVARSLTEKLLTYATGRVPGVREQPSTESLLAKSKKTDYQLRTLLHELVQSPAFRGR